MKMAQYILIDENGSTDFVSTLEGLTPQKENDTLLEYLKQFSGDYFLDNPNTETPFKCCAIDFENNISTIYEVSRTVKVDYSFTAY
jgi:hypothetical protein